MKRLSRTGIEYGDYAWNFYPGCLHQPQGICPVTNCWAEGMSKRQRQDFHQPQLLPERLLLPLTIKKPARILVNFMGDLFGDWVDPNQHIRLGDIGTPPAVTEDMETPLKGFIFQVIQQCPQHTFIFLTKRPENLIKWSPFPENCWVGVTVWDNETFFRAIYTQPPYGIGLKAVRAKHKWLSIEPLLGQIHIKTQDLTGIDWLVIGAQTGYKGKLVEFQKTHPALQLVKLSADGSQYVLLPPLEWVREIVEAANAVGIPVWLKDNLYKLLMERPAEDHDLYWEDMANQRQELPDRKVKV
ncbi:MAG: DUF5131 family protein [Dehalococcoidales bacterium]|nr:DUF5131 family protein [Dehalococcoidales bacterium]